MRDWRQKLGRCEPLQIELISLFLLFITAYLAFASYPALPATIPTHFNFRGLPDGWGDKNSIFAFPILSTFFYALLTFATILLAISQDPRRFINLPWKWKEGLTVARLERLRLFICRSLVGMKLVMQGMMAYIVYGTIEVAMGKAEGMGEFLFLFIAAIVVIDGYMLWQSFKITRKQGST